MIPVCTIEVDTDLVLRQVMPMDAEDIFNTIDRERDYLGTWLPFVEETIDINDTINFLNAIINAENEQKVCIYTIRYQEQFAGLISFKTSDINNKKTEIAYWLSENFQHKGIMTKCVKRLCVFAFQEMDINRIQIKCAIGNAPSIAIPKRLGFIFEGIERDGELLSGNKFTDLEIYSKLKAEQ